MGENFLRKQAKNFRHREDAAYSVLTVPSLLTHWKREEYKVAYHCHGLAEHIPPKGTEVWVRVVDETVQVCVGAIPIGEIDGDEGKRLIGALSEEPMRGIAAAEIDSVSTIGDFSITIKPETDDGDGE